MVFNIKYFIIYLRCGLVNNKDYVKTGFIEFLWIIIIQILSQGQLTVKDSSNQMLPQLGYFMVPRIEESFDLRNLLPSINCPTLRSRCILTPLKVHGV